MKSVKRTKRIDGLILCSAIVYFAATFLTYAHEGLDDYMMLVSSVLVVALSAVQTRGKMTLSIEPFHAFSFVFLIYCWMTSLWAVDAKQTQATTRIMTLILIVLYALYIYYRRKPIDALLITVMLGGYAVCILMLYEQGLATYLRAIALGIRVYDQNYINANAMGMLSASSIVINFYYILYHKRIKWWTIGSIPAFICMAGAGSRKSIILLLGGCVMLVLLRNFNNKKAMISILKIIFAGSVAIALFYMVLSRTTFFTGALSRFDGVIAYVTGEGTVDGSTSERAKHIEVGIELFKKYPILGCGINCPELLNPVRRAYLHNNYIELLAGGGLLGFFLFYVMYGYVLCIMWKYRGYRTPEYDICLTLMILHLALEYAYVSYSNKETYFYFMLFFLEARQLKRAAKSDEREGIEHAGRSDAQRLSLY